MEPFYGRRHSQLGQLHSTVLKWLWSQTWHICSSRRHCTEMGLSRHSLLPYKQMHTRFWLVKLT